VHCGVPCQCFHSAITAVHRALRCARDVQVVGKVKEQMDLFLEDGSHEASVAVLKALVPAVPVTTNTIREYILPKHPTSALCYNTLPVPSLLTSQ